MNMIKFRIFDKSKRKIISTSVLEFDLENKDIVIQLSTGIVDKNGVEIYEGDEVIVKGFMGVVVNRFGSYRIEFSPAIDEISYKWEDVVVFSKKNRIKI